MKAGLDLGKKHAPTGYHKTEKSQSLALDTKPLKKNAVVGYIFGYHSMAGATFWGPVHRRVRRHLYYSKLCPVSAVSSIDQRNTLFYLLEMECDDETTNQNLLQC